MEIKPVDRGGVKHLWTKIRNLLESETAGFATEDDIGPYKWGTTRNLGEKNSRYTLPAFNIGEVVPVSVSVAGTANTIVLPSGGTYLVVSGGGSRPNDTNYRSAVSGIYSGGSSIGVANYDNPLHMHGFILRLS